MSPLLDLPTDDPALAAHRERFRAAFTGLIAWRRRVLLPFAAVSILAGIPLAVLLFFLSAGSLLFPVVILLAAVAGPLFVSTARTRTALRVEPPFEVEVALKKALAAFQQKHAEQIRPLQAGQRLAGFIQAAGVVVGLLAFQGGQPPVSAAGFLMASAAYAFAVLLRVKRDALEAETVREGISLLDEWDLRLLSLPDRLLEGVLAAVLATVGILVLFL